MRHHSLPCLLSGLLIITPVEAQHLVVVSRGENALILHALPEGHITRRIPVGTFPHEIARDEAGHTVFIASYGGSTIHAVSTVDWKARAIVLEGYGPLHGIVASTDGASLWVTAEEAGLVLEVDARTGRVVRTWPTGGEQSHMLARTPDARKLYVANIRSGDVSVLSRPGEAATRVTTGQGAEGIDVTPDGTEVWVSNRGDNSVSVIDTRTDSVVTTLSTGGVFPVKVRVRPGAGEVWVVNNRSGSVAVFDRLRRRRVTTIQTGERPLGLAFSPDGRSAWVTRPGHNEVVEIDAVARTIVRRLATGASPDGILWLP